MRSSNKIKARQTKAALNNTSLVEGWISQHSPTLAGGLYR